MKATLLLIISILLLAACGGRAQLDKQLTVQIVVDRWTEDGLEVEQVTTLPAGEIPPGGTEGISFIAPNACGDCGGKVIKFSDATSAQQMGDLWASMGQHIYRSDGLLIQINGNIDQATADQYGSVTK